MASVKSVNTHSEKAWREGLLKRRYAVVLTDNQGVDHSKILMPVKVPPTDDGTATAQAELQRLIDREFGLEDKAPQWNPEQADYDRRSLGYAMTLPSTDQFYTYLPLYLAMTGRGGNNAGQRATYLGVTRADYDLMAARFNDVQGIEFFLVDAKGQVWETLPADWN